MRIAAVRIPCEDECREKRYRYLEPSRTGAGWQVLRYRQCAKHSTHSHQRAEWRRSAVETAILDRMLHWTLIATHDDATGFARDQGNRQAMRGVSNTRRLTPAPGSLIA